MKKTLLLTLFAIFGSFTACSASNSKYSELGDGLFADIQTSKGSIIVQLEYNKAPITTMSFVGLAEGKFPEGADKPFFDGLSFHRVVQGFVIQGGDPSGNGTGGPGYQFPNEIDPSLSHNAEGILSMANSGPDTNGSQFFITLAPAPQLDGGYSVFGRVVQGMDVVKEIAEGDIMNKVRIIRNGADAQAYQADWSKFQEMIQKHAQASIDEAKERSKTLAQYIDNNWPDDFGTEALQNPDQLQSKIITAGSGPKAKDLGAATYTMHYTLWVAQSDGTVAKVDSSVDRGEPLVIDPARVIEAWAVTLPDMRKGEKRLLWAPSDFAYGSSSPTPQIPKFSTLLFEMEAFDLSSEG